MIRRALEDKGITITAIASRCGVTRPHVSQIIHGKRDSRRIQAAIIAALGFDPWSAAKKAGRAA